MSANFQFNTIPSSKFSLSAQIGLPDSKLTNATHLGLQVEPVGLLSKSICQGKQGPSVELDDNPDPLVAVKPGESKPFSKAKKRKLRRKGLELNRELRCLFCDH